MTGLSPEVFTQTLNLTDMRITKILVMLFSLTLACCTERKPIEFEPYPYVPGGATGTPDRQYYRFEDVSGEMPQRSYLRVSLDGETRFGFATN